MCVGIGLVAHTYVTQTDILAKSTFSGRAFRDDVREMKTTKKNQVSATRQEFLHEMLKTLFEKVKEKNRVWLVIFLPLFIRTKKHTHETLLR